MPRTSERIIQEMLGAQQFQLAVLIAKVEALEEQVAQAKPKRQRLKAVPPSEQKVG